VSTPSHIITSKFYRYLGGYQPVRYLLPGEGYWVKTDQAGTLVFSGGTFSKHEQGNPSTASTLDDANELVFRDSKDHQQTLYFVATSDSVVRGDQYELPPTPPAGAFDVRFSSGRMLEIADPETGGTFPLTVSPVNGPVHISWRIVDDGMEAQLFVGEEQYAMRGEGSIELESISAKVTLILGNGAEKPVAFSLEQNYPNPFNPSTTISYALPKSSHVKVGVYDVLGREVATVLNEEKSAGAYTIQWDATDVSSGVYLYRMKAGDFTAIRKMLLIK
jgi:hypothetical protein